MKNLFNVLLEKVFSVQKRKTLFLINLLTLQLCLLEMSLVYQ